MNLNIGLAETDFYSRFYLWRICDEGCFPLEQEAKLLFDFNFIYQKNILGSLFASAGIDINQKGFIERGYEPTGFGTNYFYTESFSLTFISLYLGLSYNIHEGNKLIINVSQLVCPEFTNANPELYKSYPISTRTNISFAHKISETFSVKLTPFFESSLSSYNKIKVLPNSSNWNPYSYGIDVGLEW